MLWDVLLNHGLFLIAFYAVFFHRSEKKEWLQKYNVTWPDPIFVPGKRLKCQYAQPNTIIIDDTWSVIEDWRNHNGIAIWHKDAISTINQLEMYVKSPK